VRPALIEVKAKLPLNEIGLLRSQIGLSQPGMHEARQYFGAIGFTEIGNHPPSPAHAADVRSAMKD
jgi:hypothetical protein